MPKAASSATKPAAPQEWVDRPSPFWRFMRGCSRLFVPIWFRYRARGVEMVPSRGPALLLINHQSFLDPMLAGVPLARPVSYLARDSLFRIPFVGWVIKNMDVMPINRKSASSSSLRLAAERLQQGRLVGIFPEGTRSDDGQIGPLKPGFIALVRRAGVPVVPVGIAGSGAAFPRDKWFIRPRRCRVVFGEPISAADVEKLGQRGSEQLLLDEVRKRMVSVHRDAQEWLEKG